MGGLLYGGKKGPDGQILSNGHLSFDQYDQDQIFAIDAGQTPLKRTLLVISDRGDWSMSATAAELQRIKALPSNERKPAMERFTAAHPGDHPRVVLGRSADRSSVLRLADPEGHDSIVMEVAADGTPSLQFLDQNGKVIDQLPRPVSAKP